MIKVAFLNNWGEPYNDLLDRYSKQTPGNSGIWKNLQGTLEITKADIFVVLEGAQEDTTFDKERSIFVKREPDYIKPGFPDDYKNVIDWEASEKGNPHLKNAIGSFEYHSHSGKVSVEPFGSHSFD